MTPDMKRFEANRGGLPRVNNGMRIGNPDGQGQLIIHSPKGREVIVKPEQVLQLLSRDIDALKQQVVPTNTNVADIGVAAERINKAQFDNVINLMDLALTTASKLNPHFNDEGRSMEDKLGDAVRVIVVASEANITFEKNTLEAARYNYLQNVLSTLNQAVADGLLKSSARFAPEDQKLFLKLLSRTLDIVHTEIAANMDPAQVERGTKAIVAIADASANASEARQRAKIATDLERQKVEKERQELANLTKKNNLERIHTQESNKAQRAQAAEIHARQVASLEEANKQERHLAEVKHANEQRSEQMGALMTGIKKIPSEILNGSVNFVFDENNGAIIKITKSLSGSLDYLSTHMVTTRLIGLSGGATVGLVGGLIAGTETLAYVAGATEVATNVATLIVWAPAVGMAVFLGSAGAYLGPNIIQGIKHTKDGIVDLKDATATKINTWRQNRANKNNQSGPGSQNP